MKNRNRLILLTALLGAACGHIGTTGRTALATLEPRSGSSATGTIKFTELVDGRVRVTVNVRGTTPGVHGFHIHETGDCSATDALSAGPHFNPASSSHGGLDTPSRHAGDFGNLTADESGNIKLEFATGSITLAESPVSILGRAVVLHAAADDLTSQPAGNSGSRIACGVVTSTSKP